MCGLVGVARQKDAPDLDFSKEMLEALLVSIETRGKHATGIAACGGSNPFIFKWAEPASKVIEAEVWKEQMKRVAPDTPVLLGHTRHATLANANQDEAAHPFMEGKVVGAHNGIIYNWMDIARAHKRHEGDDRLIVDSQAAFVLLNAFKKPEKALQKLDGYFALTWTKGRHLYMARSSAPLAVAYIPELRTMYWHSEKFKLEKMLKDSGFDKKEFSVWEPKEGWVYKFDPTKFDANLTNVQSWDGQFKGEKKRKINTARPPMMQGWGDRKASQHQSPNLWTDEEWEEFIGTPMGSKGGPHWDPVQAKEVFPEEKRRRTGGKGVSLIDLDKEMGAVLHQIGKLQKEIVALKDENTKLRLSLGATQAQVEKIDADQEYLFDVMVESGFMEEGEGAPEDPEDDGELYEEAEEFTCHVCRKSDSGKGMLVEDHEGRLIHTRCVFNKVAVA
jgi:predicted glutamine amidotransferase/regulator of replication initiation timing